MTALSDLEPQQQLEIAARSSVKIEMNAKGLAQVKVAIYAGEEEDEMQRIKDLAIRTYETTIRELGQRAAASG